MDFFSFSYDFDSHHKYFRGWAVPHLHSFIKNDFVCISEECKILVLISKLLPVSTVIWIKIKLEYNEIFDSAFLYLKIHETSLLYVHS